MEILRISWISRVSSETSDIWEHRLEQLNVTRSIDHCRIDLKDEEIKLSAPFRSFSLQWKYSKNARNNSESSETGASRWNAFSDEQLIFITARNKFPTRNFAALAIHTKKKRSRWPCFIRPNSAREGKETENHFLPCSPRCHAAPR